MATLPSLRRKNDNQTAPCAVSGVVASLPAVAAVPLVTIAHADAHVDATASVVDASTATATSPSSLEGINNVTVDENFGPVMATQIMEVQEYSDNGVEMALLATSGNDLGSASDSE